MIACHHACSVERGHNAHIGAGGYDSADEPREEVLVVALKHLPANELPKEGRHEHG